MANNEPQAREELLQQLRHRHITANEIIKKYDYVFDLITNYFNVDKQQLIDFIRGLDDELQRINEEAR
ncbi:hypothetical protein ACYSNL_10085 [Enterococcus cecorum]